MNHQQLLIKSLELLYHSSDISASLNIILRMLGEILGAHRAYVFELNSDVLEYDNTFEWCTEGIVPQMQNLQHVPQENLSIWEEMFKVNHVVRTSDIRDQCRATFEVLDAQNIKALLVCPLLQNDKYIGFMGVDDCSEHREWEYEEQQILQSVTSLVSTALARLRNEERLDRAKMVMETVLDSVNSLVYVSDINTDRLVFVNQVLATELGVKNKEELVGRICWETIQIGQKKRCSFCPITALERAGNPPDGITWEFCNTITNRWYKIHDKIIEWVDGTKVHFESAVDITDMKKVEANLVSAASTDTMTGLLNRAAGLGVLSHTLGNTKITGQPFTVVFMDIDELKMVNDTYGHNDGDYLITKTCAVMRKAVRTSDIICRLGGDEFLIILPGCTSVVAAQIMINIQKEFDMINASGQRPYRFSASYGTCEVTAIDKVTADEIVKIADESMYLNKQGKKRQVAVKDTGSC